MDTGGKKKLAILKVYTTFLKKKKCPAFFFKKGLCSRRSVVQEGPSRRASKKTGPRSRKFF